MLRVRGSDRLGLRLLLRVKATFRVRPLVGREADFRKRQIEKKEAETKADKNIAEAADRKRACEDSRSYFKALQDRQPIVRTDPKTGERVYLSDNEYSGELSRAQRSVERNCK